MASSALKAKITGIDDQSFSDRAIITVQFDDGDPQGPWVQSFAVNKGKPISPEEFLTTLKQRHLDSKDSQVHIGRPQDPLRFLKEVAEETEKPTKGSGEPVVTKQGKEFQLDLSEPKKEAEDGGTEA